MTENKIYNLFIKYKYYKSISTEYFTTVGIKNVQIVLKVFVIFIIGRNFYYLHYYVECASVSTMVRNLRKIGGPRPSGCDLVRLQFQIPRNNTTIKLTLRQFKSVYKSFSRLLNTVQL